MSRNRSAASVLIVALLLPILAACGGSTATTTPTSAPAPTTAAAPAATSAAAPAATSDSTGGTTAGSTTYTKDKPPVFAQAAAAKQFSGQTITYYGDSVGLGAELDNILVKQFTADTGINVKIVPKPQSATENYSVYQRFFQAQSTDVDVMMLDVIWPGAFAQHLLDVSGKLGDVAKQHYPGIIENNTVDGKLVAIPWFGDFGILYYRTDLLTKYGFSGPPKTWDELETQAKKIAEGERAANPTFAGFVFQGNAYEGLTCNVLEWLASSGGGQIIEDGKVTINNPQAIAFLNKAKGWIGTIAPQGVTGYQEEDARNVFQSGNAAFMRNWPYAYALAKEPDAQGNVSPVAKIFDVAPLPAAEGQKPVGTVGGWQLAISKYSKNPDAAIEFVRYMTSPEVETYRAIVGSYVPTMPAVAEDANVIKAMPFLKTLADVQRVTRPSRTTGEQYNQASTVVFQAVNQILNGQDAAQLLPQAESQLSRLAR